MYSAASGAAVFAGRWSGGALSGNAALGDLSSAGGMATAESGLAGGATLGDVTASGGFTGYVPPAWLVGRAVDETFAISGTVHAGSAADPTDNPADAFCRSNKRLSYSNIGIAGSQVVLAAVGGHNDSADNAVTSIELDVDAPAWVLNLARTNSPTPDVAWQSDGKPTSRHAYWSGQYSTTRSRFFQHYVRFANSSAMSFADTSGFDLAANLWDADNTWSDAPGPVGCRDTSDNVWALSNSSGQTLEKWTAATDTWSTTFTSGVAGPLPPMAYDSVRDQIFAMSYGDGLGGGSGLNAAKYTSGGTVRTTVTINASAVYTQWLADAPINSSMEYDPVNDCFYYWDGITRRLFKITPNAGTAWDISIVTTTGSTIPAMVYAFGRMKYVPALKGLVFMPAGNLDLYFMRTA